MKHIRECPIFVCIILNMFLHLSVVLLKNIVYYSFFCHFFIFFTKFVLVIHSFFIRFFSNLSRAIHLFFLTFLYSKIDEFSSNGQNISQAMVGLVSRYPLSPE
jgi:hypothetical protein